MKRQTDGCAAVKNGMRTSPVRAARSRGVAGSIAVLWACSAGAGWWVLARYEVSPETAGAQTPSWPADCSIGVDDTKYSLLLFAHPHCPCTRASIGELERLLATAGEYVRTTVVFYRPRDASDEWVNSDLWNKVKGMQGIEARIDPGAESARRFGVGVSGHALLYGSDGRLRFSGGITTSRGHEGDNLGRSSIVAILRGKTPLTQSSAVFGCRLFPAGSADTTQ